MKAFDITFIGAVIALIACFIPLWLGPNKSTLSNLLKAIAAIIAVIIILIILKFYYGFESDIFNFESQKPVESFDEEPGTGYTEASNKGETKDPEKDKTDPYNSSDVSGEEQTESSDTDKSVTEKPDSTVDDLDTNNTNVSQSEEIKVKITSFDQFDFSSNNEKALPDYVKDNLGFGITKGIFGTFDYSRELTEEEKNNWSFSGNLYDKAGNIIENDGIAPTFYTDLDGHFAVGLQESTEPGKYTYELILYIGIYSVTEYIDFSID